MKITNLTLQNFKGYEKAYFQFDDGEGVVQPISLFYGPNGIGKSSVLEAVQFVANTRIFDGRGKDDIDLYMRSLIHDDDYSPQADHVLEKAKNALMVAADFSDNYHDYEVVLDQNGFRKRLPNAHGGYAFYVDADNASNLAKFQLMDVQAKTFVDLAEAIYGYNVDLDGEVWDEMTGEDGVTVKHLFYNDLILLKGRKKVHYAQMSDGEKKIATLLRQLCNPDNTEGRDILLIDNIEMHVYYKRHKVMLEKLLDLFKGKQIIATTHSPEMINAVDPEWRYDLEKFRPDYATTAKAQSFEDFHTSDNDPEKPKTIEEFFERVAVINQRLNAQYPDWAYESHPIEQFEPFHENAILIDLDDNTGERVFDPIQHQYKPGMLQTRQYPITGAQSTARGWTVAPTIEPPPTVNRSPQQAPDPSIDTPLDKPVNDVVDKYSQIVHTQTDQPKKVFKPLDDLIAYVDRLRRKL